MKSMTDLFGSSTCCEWFVKFKNEFDLVDRSCNGKTQIFGSNGLQVLLDYDPPYSIYIGTVKKNLVSMTQQL